MTTLRMTRLGVTVEIRKTADDTGGELLEFDVVGRARGLLTQTHVHTGQSERVEHGDARDVIERPGHPYTRALVEAVPPRKQRHALAGELPDAAAVPPGCRFHPRCPKRFEPCDSEDPPLLPTGEPAHEAACLLLRRG